MRNVIIAGVSAVALTLSGAAFAAGADNGGAMNGQNDTSTSSSMSSGASHSMKSGQHGQIMQVQQKLQQEGLYKGKVDGVDGKETRSALKQYQAKNGLDQTGKLDSQTAEKLGLNTEGNATEGSGSSAPPPQSPGASDTGNQAGGASTAPHTGTMSK